MLVEKPCSFGCEFFGRSMFSSVLAGRSWPRCPFCRLGAWLGLGGWGWAEPELLVGETMSIGSLEWCADMVPKGAEPGTTGELIGGRVLSVAGVVAMAIWDGRSGVGTTRASDMMR